MLLFTLFWVFACALTSESLAVPTLRGRNLVSEAGWRKPNVTQSLPDLISIASAALERAITGASTVSQFDGQTFEVVATLYAEMAELDMITNKTQYEDTLQQDFSTTQETRPNFSAPETYGYAAIRAYVAYQNSVFLQYATQSWSFGNSYTISQTSTSLAAKNFTLETSCNGATMAGGTFWTMTPSDPSIAAMSTGYFMLLSALLYEATSTPSYLQATTDSANFIQSHLTTTNGLVLQIISGSKNDSCEVLDDAVNSFNSGLFIEGLAVLVSQTQDTTTQTLLENLITNVLSNPTWQTTTGIIANGASKEGDAILVRALTAAYVRNVTTPAIRQNLYDYLAVQFNAVVDLATAGDGIYAAQWTGPPSSSFSLNNQTSALSPLLSAAYLSNATTSVSSTSHSTPPITAFRPLLDRLCATIGRALVVAIAIVVYFIFRRCAQGRQLKAPDPMSPAQPALSQSGYTVPGWAHGSDSQPPPTDPSFASPSVSLLPPPPSTHPSVVPPTDFSFIPRSYAAVEKGGRRTFISMTSGTSSYGNPLPDTSAALPESRRPEGGEEPPPEYIAVGR
ncbi:hypothetical protein K438DRAFT_1987328 [Mycena galopus ATCC 62051]|nr:hypothetical protein K438DRAFT_1987328 [Mycena galopus ATCC 62051]